MHAEVLRLLKQNWLLLEVACAFLNSHGPAASVADFINGVESEGAAGLSWIGAMTTMQMSQADQ